MSNSTSDFPIGRIIIERNPHIAKLFALYDNTLINKEIFNRIHALAVSQCDVQQ